MKREAGSGKGEAGRKGFTEEKAKRNFENLIVWQKAYELTGLVYAATQEFPKSEQYGLVSQLRRCAVSVPSNIAEGYMRNHIKEYKQFIGVALGSTAELQTQLMIARDLVAPESTLLSKALSLSNEVTAILITMIRKIEDKEAYQVREDVSYLSLDELDLPPSPFTLTATSPAGDADA